MKKIFAFFMAAVMIFGLTACSGKVDIDYGESDIYSKVDMDAAIELIKEEFSSWEGCELHSIRYSSDDYNNSETVGWMNDLGDEKDGFTQCIMFVSDFHSPKAGGGAWNADSEYTHWQWWLARSGDGAWKLMTNGY